MAKKSSKFNWPGSPSANEIGEEMAFANQPAQNNDGNQPIGRKRTARTKTEGWTLVQCRLPNDLNRRMSLYNANNDVTKNDFMVEAVRALLDKLGA